MGGKHPDAKEVRRRSGGGRGWERGSAISSEGLGKKREMASCWSAKKEDDTNALN